MNEKQASVAAQIAELACLPMSELWTVWDRYFPRRPDYPNRNHVESRIAYKLQEEAFGGLAPETKQRLEAIGAKHSKIKLRAKPREFDFAPGTILLREWGDREHKVPAPEIEAAVVAQIRTVLTSPETVASVVRHIQRNGAQIDEATTVMAMGRLNNVWDQLFPVERHRIANLMIERIDLIHAGEVQGIKVKWREVGWNALIAEFAPDSIGAELLEVEA
jgi:hypothetical protein